MWVNHNSKGGRQFTWVTFNNNSFEVSLTRIFFKIVNFKHFQVKLVNIHKHKVLETNPAVVA